MLDDKNEIMKNVSSPLTDKDYKQWLGDLKLRIKQSQIKASVKVNSAMLGLYWSIGADIVASQAESVWGSGILKQLSQDLRAEFPDVRGFSLTNLKYMKKFFLFYSNHTISPQLGGLLTETENPAEMPKEISHQAGDQFEVFFSLGTIPWRHHVEIISHCKSIQEAFPNPQERCEGRARR
jgi:hypothetical protein